MNEFFLCLFSHLSTERLIFGAFCLPFKKTNYLCRTLGHNYMQKYLLKISLVAMLAFASMLPAQAQLKIGFADLELLLAFMPEAQAVERELNTYSETLAKSIQSKQNYAQTKLAEFQERAEEAGESLPPEELQSMEAELQKLQQELVASQQDAEQKLLKRRSEKLGPILDKVQASIDALAKEEGYTYILNTTSGGTSMVLHGSDQFNVTKNLMNRLKIPIPEGMDD